MQRLFGVVGYEKEIMDRPRPSGFVNENDIPAGCDMAIETHEHAAEFKQP